MEPTEEDCAVLAGSSQDVLVVRLEVFLQIHEAVVSAVCGLEYEGEGFALLYLLLFV